MGPKKIRRGHEKEEYDIYHNLSNKNVLGGLEYKRAMKYITL